MAPVRGLEPLTHRLTVDCATIAPHRNGFMKIFDLKGLKTDSVLPYCQVYLNPKRGFYNLFQSEYWSLPMFKHIVKKTKF